jgi:hypothetical protein
MIVFGMSHTVRNNSGQDGERLLGTATRLPPVRRPNHCGDDMQLTMQGAVAARNSPPLGVSGDGRDLHLVWQCRCGFRLDPHPAPPEV